MPLAVPFLVVAPFAAIFATAAGVEFRRWRRHGPSMNQRARFQFDRTAPSYEPPEKVRLRTLRQARRGTAAALDPVATARKTPAKPG